MSSAVLAALAAAFAAAVSGFFGLRTATRANRPAEMNAQLAWVKSAQDDAASAKAEAAVARGEAEAARQQAEVTRQQQVTIRRELDAMQDWVDRVVRARDAYVADHPAEALEDSGVIRILRAINGGPHITKS